MSEPLIWIHGDCLAPQSPVLRRWPTARRLFVFDDTILDRDRISFKRIVFLYESLLELDGIEIHRGSAVSVLIAAAIEAGTSRIATIESVDPDFQQTVRRLELEGPLKVEIVPAAPFVPLSRVEEDRLDLKRFSRFWQNIRGRALSLSGSPEESI